jgi:hypothetical protein
MRRLRRRRSWVVLVVIVAVIGGNTPVIAQYVRTKLHQIEIDRPSYKAKYGYWETIELPTPERVNAVHTALMNTGKLLIIAGSGNDQQFFNAGTFKTLVWDPTTGKAKLIPTPDDFFCGGHAFLPNGNLLVAGGTARYEVLAPKVQYAGGIINIENRLPKARVLAKGTVFVSPTGGFYKSDATITLLPAVRGIGKGGRRVIKPTREDVWVGALVKGQAGMFGEKADYRIVGPGRTEAATLTASGGKMTLEKENFHGTNAAFEFDPVTERYVYVLPMPHKRWYPTLTTEENGNILAVSGLDGAGEIQPGATDEFNYRTGRWG